MTSLIDRLALERVNRDVFTGFTAGYGAPRIFGGAAVAQALLAAYETVDGLVCNSLHSYFIHPGEAAVPITFEVGRIRDGSSFATRRVAMSQGGRPILEMTASFQVPDDGPEHQAAVELAPLPDALVDDDPRGDSAGLQLRNIELPRPGFAPTARPPRHRMWFRSRAPLPDGIRFHQAALAYASDFPQLPTIIQPHVLTWNTPGFQFTSLDHALWFHRSFDFNRWHLCDMDTPSSAGGRGLSRGTIHAEDGAVVASVAQEAMIRMRARPGA